jgi:hypothetical protein
MFRTYAAELKTFIKGLGYTQIGWQVCAYVGGDMDTPIEVIGHSAVFRFKADAERFAASIQSHHNKVWPAPSIDSSKWILAAHDDYVAGFRREPGEEQPALYSPLMERPPLSHNPSF